MISSILTPALSEALDYQFHQKTILLISEALGKIELSSDFLPFHKHNTAKIREDRKRIVPFFSGWIKKDEIILITENSTVQASDAKKVKKVKRIIFKVDGFSVTDVYVKRFYDFNNNIKQRIEAHKDLFEDHPDYFADYPHLINTRIKNNKNLANTWEISYENDLQIFKSFEKTFPDYRKVFISALCSVARGMEAMHKRKLVHLDIKTPNIFLDATFKGRISDFDLISNDQVVDKHPRDYFAWDSLLILTGKITFFCDVYSFTIMMLDHFYGARLGGYGKHSSRNKTYEKLLKAQNEMPPEPARDRAFKFIEKVLREDLSLIEKVNNKENLDQVTHSMTKSQDCIAVCDEILKVTVLKP